MNRIDLRGPKPSQQHAPLTRAKSAAYAAVLVLGLYFAQELIPRGWITYMLSLFPSFIVMVTAVARLNDIDSDMDGHRWQIRRMGLGLTAMFAGWMVVRPFIGEGWPSWGSTFGIWGFALTWLTTPHLPPWRRWMRDDYSGPKPHRRRKEDDFDGRP